MVKYIDKPSVKDKLRWLLTHNKNYTKEQIYTLSDLEDQINHILSMVTSPEDYVGNGIYDDKDELLYNIQVELKGE